MTEYDQFLPRILANALRAGRPEQVATHLNAAPRELDAQFATLARDRWHVPYISYFSILCTPTCRTLAAPGVPMLFDEHHLTSAGSVVFAQALHDRQTLPVENLSSPRTQK